MKPLIGTTAYLIASIAPTCAGNLGDVVGLHVFGLGIYSERCPTRCSPPYKQHDALMLQVTADDFETAEKRIIEWLTEYKPWLLEWLRK